jgi:radical SAM superfamily enzyme YgiQ (UPF0313 family)
MKVLLIYPYANLANRTGPSWLPLGLSFIAGVLQRDGHVVSVFDRYAYAAKQGAGREKTNAAMLARIREFGPDLIGFNTVSPLIYDTSECVDLIRAQGFGGYLVAGGHHATALPELTLSRISGLDGVVSGEGEMPLARLAGGGNPASVPGVWWRSTGGTAGGQPPQQVTDLDSLPFPAFELLDMDFYTRPGLHTLRGYYLRVVSLLTSRGCVKKCHFCAESLTYGRGVRMHSVDYVMEWLKRLRAEYHFEAVYFHDNDFLLDEDRVGDFCGRLLAGELKGKLKWGIQTRVEHLNGDILKLMRRAGCVLIELGVESPLQNQLDWVRKGVTVTTAERAIALCRQAGITVHANILTGFGGETIADLEYKLAWLKKVKPNRYSWFPLKLHPGTVLYDRQAGGFFEENEWTREKVDAYYAADLMSAVPAGEKERWLRRYYETSVRRQNLCYILRVNPPHRIAAYLRERVKDRLAGSRVKKQVNK